MNRYFLICLKNKNPHNIFANTIREVEQLPYSHVEILKEYDTGEYVSFGSVSPLSRWVTLEELEKTYEIRDKIPLNLAVTDAEATIIIASMMGKPYSKFQILVICAKLLLQRAFSWLPHVKANLSSLLICTELAGNFMRDACGYKIDISTETLTLRECVGIAKKALLTAKPTA